MPIQFRPINVRLVSLFIYAILIGCVGSPTKHSGPLAEKGLQKESSKSALEPAGAGVDSPANPLYAQTQADYHFYLGEAYSNEGNPAKAIESFKAAIAFDPKAVTLHMRLASEYVKNAMVSEAISSAQAAAELSPKDPQVAMFLGGIYAGLKAYDKAQQQYEVAHRLDSHLPDPLIYLGAISSEQDRFDQAIKYFQKVLQIKEYNNPHLIHYYLGRVYLEKKDRILAESSFKKAVRLKGSFAEPVLALANLYESDSKKTKLIVQFLLEFQKKNGPHPKVTELLANRYLEEKKYDEAYEQLESLEALTDDPLGIKMKLAFLLIQKKMHSLAAEKLEEILTEAPESEKIRFYLAVVYSESKEAEKALQHFGKIHPESSFYGEAVVQSVHLLRGAGQTSQALTTAREALEKREDVPVLYATYAGLLEEAKNYKEASSVLKKGREKFPENTQILFYSGAISEKLQDRGGTIGYMKKVLVIDPEHAQAMNYLAYTWAEVGENLEEAENLARSALNQEPKDGFIMDTLGWVLFRQGKTKEALQYLEAAARIQTEVGVIMEHLGDVYQKMSLGDKAIRAYSRALELEQDPQKRDKIKDKISSLESPSSIPVRVPASK